MLRFLLRGANVVQNKFLPETIMQSHRHCVRNLDDCDWFKEMQTPQSDFSPILVCAMRDYIQAGPGSVSF